jgi:hypothetical protein
MSQLPLLGKDLNGIEKLEEVIGMLNESESCLEVLSREFALMSLDMQSIAIAKLSIMQALSSMFFILDRHDDGILEGLADEQKAGLVTPA